MTRPDENFQTYIEIIMRKILNDNEEIQVISGEEGKGMGDMIE